MAIPQSIHDMTVELTGWRRDLHQHPEVGFELDRTTEFVARKLIEFGCEKVVRARKTRSHQIVETTINGKTRTRKKAFDPDPARTEEELWQRNVTDAGVAVGGVVGVLKGRQASGKKGKTIMLRADMDALPMAEMTSAPYKSVHEGKFHGCGHDGHTTCLLGAARHLAATRNFEGTVYFCFQPAEEGEAGAKAMVQSGLFRRFRTSAIYGAHNWPTTPIGFMGFKDGQMLAASNEFWIEITGQGGHGARPHQAHDPLVVGAQLVMDLQTVVSRMIDPVETAVLSVTQFEAGTTTNVIPGTARLAGTLRSFSNEVMAQMVAAIELKCGEISLSENFNAEVKFTPYPYPALINSRPHYKLASTVGVELCGEPMYLLDMPRAMGSEDFAYYLTNGHEGAPPVKGCFMIFGNGNESKMLHHPEYDFNDQAIPHMVAYWTRLVETLLPPRNQPPARRADQDG
ncbi:amidohydrolase [Rhodobacteraceae bacterium NNCM2]|nr:amidohydrolase [Coraliihabitans acroporae]